MPRIQISDEDVKNPTRLRQRMEFAYASLYDLLDKVSTLQNAQQSAPAATAPATTPAAAPAGLQFTASDRALLDALATGSTSSPIPGQLALVPTVSALPPVTNATPGQLVNFGGTIYRFDGPTLAWVSISAATPANMMTTDTNQTPGAAVVKTWTANQLFNGGLTGNVTGNASGSAGTVASIAAHASTELSDSAALARLAGANFTGRVTFSAGQAWGLQSASTNPYTIAAGSVAVVGKVVAGASTVNMPAAGNAVGDIYIIKDALGNAAANNITVSGNGVNIDGAATIVISTNYGVVRVFWTGSIWETW